MGEQVTDKLVADLETYFSSNDGESEVAYVNAFFALIKQVTHEEYLGIDFELKSLKLRPELLEDHRLKNGGTLYSGAINVFVGLPFRIEKVAFEAISKIDFKRRSFAEYATRYVLIAVRLCDRSRNIFRSSEGFYFERDDTQIYDLIVRTHAHDD